MRGDLARAGVLERGLQHGVGAEAERVLEREVGGEGREPLPERAHALGAHDGGAAVRDAPVRPRAVQLQPRLDDVDRLQAARLHHAADRPRRRLHVGGDRCPPAPPILRRRSGLRCRRHRRRRRGRGGGRGGGGHFGRSGGGLSGCGARSGFWICFRGLLSPLLNPRKVWCTGAAYVGIDPRAHASRAAVASRLGPEDQGPHGANLVQQAGSHTAVSVTYYYWGTRARYVAERDSREGGGRLADLLVPLASGCTTRRRPVFRSGALPTHHKRPLPLVIPFVRERNTPSAPIPSVDMVFFAQF